MCVPSPVDATSSTNSTNSSSYRADRTPETGKHRWPRCLRTEEWAPRRHGQIQQQKLRGRGAAGPRADGAVRAPGTVSGGGAEVLRSAHQRGAGMGRVLPELPRAHGASAARRHRLRQREGAVLHPPAPGRNRVLTAGAPGPR